MKRSNFLKSLFVSIISPKVVVEALKEERSLFAGKPVMAKEQVLAAGNTVVYGEDYNRDYGPITRLEPQWIILYWGEDGKVKSRPATEWEITRREALLLHGGSYYTGKIDIDAMQNIR